MTEHESGSHDLALQACYAVTQEDAHGRSRFAWRQALSEYIDGNIDAGEMERHIDEAIGLGGKPSHSASRETRNP